MIKKLIDWVIIVFGIIMVAYGLIGIFEYGFYISGRGDPGQLEGGLVPLFLLLGIMAVAYGFIDLRLKADSDNSNHG